MSIPIQLQSPLILAQPIPSPNPPSTHQNAYLHEVKLYAYSGVYLFVYLAYIPDECEFFDKTADI